MRPLISVVMSTYNERAVIGEAIDSLLQQTLHSWELLVVDDASTDGTAEFVTNTYPDPRISLVRMPVNSGAGACRNLAVSIAVGEFVAVLDADDVCLPHRLQTQIDAFRDNPDVSVVSSQTIEFGDWGGPVLGRWPTTEKDIRHRQAARKMPVSHSSAMFRRAELLEVGAWDEACPRGEDFGLMLRLSDRRIIALEEALVMYRTRRPISFAYALEDEMSHTLALRRHQGRLRATPPDQLPTKLHVSPGVLMRAAKNWLVRTARETLAK
ncbi:Chondroitin polymerase [Kocuria rosea]|nr:Chondroitin polymerase [Kocuria rosea]